MMPFCSLPHSGSLHSHPMMKEMQQELDVKDFSPGQCADGGCRKGSVGDSIALQFLRGEFRTENPGPAGDVCFFM